jgi:hypothetical protein
LDGGKSHDAASRLVGFLHRQSDEAGASHAGRTDVPVQAYRSVYSGNDDAAVLSRRDVLAGIGLAGVFAVALLGRRYGKLYRATA